MKRKAYTPRSWTVRKQLIALAGTLLALMLILGAVSYFGMRQVDKIADLAIHKLRKAATARELSSFASREYAIHADTVIKQSTETKEFEHITSLFQQARKRVVALDNSKEEQECATAIESAALKFEKVYLETVLPAVHRLKQAQDPTSKLKAMEELAALDGLVDEQVVIIEAQGSKLAGLAEREAEEANNRYDQVVNSVTTATSVLAVTMLLGGIGFSVWLSHRISRALGGIAIRLSAGSEETAAAASQVSQAGQSLAEGASRQAASLEETSASLEETASMTQRNSENARKAQELARQTRTAADKGANDMQSMLSAMDAIKSAGDETAKIIKTIDEIAFQTNILALNAAVEAARAGEAGMGFAVVANEVRNLAQRSAVAARETSQKIEGSLKRTANGVDISLKVEASLREITEKIRQVDDLVSQVSQASSEQTEGIRQINVAMGQIDQQTQASAASAEQSAAAAGQLHDQAESMKQSVDELMELAGTESGPTDSNPSQEPSRQHVPPPPSKGVSGRQRHDPSKATAEINGEDMRPATNEGGAALKKKTVIHPRIPF